MARASGQQATIGFTTLRKKMKRFDLWKAKLKMAKAELRIRGREANAAARAVIRVQTTITQLEKKIDDYLAKS
jgi:hypothetical protein